MSQRPRIGLTLDVDPAGATYLLKTDYADAVVAAGGLPLPLPHRPGAAAEWIDLCDALVITGGAFDVSPELYGEVRRPGCGPARPERTRAELELIELALARDLPLLGVCGGMQLLAVALGGTLHQDLAADLGLGGHEQPDPKDRPSHAVEVAPGTLLASLVGPGHLAVNSTHHQAVRAPGRGAVVSARAPDGIIEAIEVAGHRFALGVQWHPEAALRHEPRHAAIYAGLVAAARSGGRR
jgi:putative glutamine amidotransferase